MAENPQPLQPQSKVVMHVKGCIRIKSSGNVTVRQAG